MKHLKLTFGDIAQSRILYYDKEVEKACVTVCEALKIDNMPAYDSEYYYEMENGQFVKKAITTEDRLKSADRIFEDGLIQKFASDKNNVLFVYKGEVLTGIVHYSDYNQTGVLQAIQDDVLTFERKMRQYLFLRDYRNEDMLEYFQYRADKDAHSKRYFEGRISTYEKRKDKLNQLGEFQMFDLKDLLEFGKSSKSAKLFPSQYVEVNGSNILETTLVNSLRNIAMHGKNPVELDEESSVYSIESLKYLFLALKTLETFTYRIEKLIWEDQDYQKSKRMDNRNKLEIISQNHPKALDYFLRY